MTEVTEYMMRLRSGNYFDFEHLNAPQPVTLDDVASGLANECRYGGQCDPYYSVAEHAVGVADRLRDQGFPLEVQLKGLHHDDAEGIIKDMPRPVKILLPDYNKMEHKVLHSVMLALGLDHLESVDDRAIKAADNWMLAQEYAQLMTNEAQPLPRHAEGGEFQWDGEFRRFGLSPLEAKLVWLARHEYLIQMAQVEEV